MSSLPANLWMNEFARPRAGRPENARVMTVVSFRAARIDCLCASDAPDSGHVRKAVPSAAVEGVVFDQVPAPARRPDLHAA